MGNDQRIETGVQRGKEIEIFIDNHPIRAYEGETIAGVLSAIGIRQIRHAPQLKDPRGFYCCMGSCHGCLVTVDGRPNERACVTPVQAGQHITLQEGFGRPDRAAPDPHRPPGTPGDAAGDCRRGTGRSQCRDCRCPGRHPGPGHR